MTRVIRNLIDLAKDILDVNNHYSSNHLSFLTRRNTIIAIGRNYEDKSHTFASRWGYLDGAIHSELDVILKVSRQSNTVNQLRYYTLWNVRLNRRLQVMLSKPCNRCQRLIHSVGIRRIYYTTNLDNDFVPCVEQ